MVTTLLHYRGRVLTALSFSGIALWLALAIGSYHERDPSFDYTNTGRIDNLMGATGAWVANLLLQLVGAAAWILPAGLMIWAAIYWLRLLQPRQPLRLIPLRALLLFLCLIPTASLLSAFEAPPEWSIGTGLGGFMGYRIMTSLEPFIGTFVVGLIGTLTAVACFFLATTPPLRRVAGMMYEQFGVIRRGTSHFEIRDHMEDIKVQRVKHEKEQLPEEEPHIEIKPLKARMKAPLPSKPKRNVKITAPALPTDDFELPSMEFLKDSKEKAISANKSQLDSQAKNLELVLKDFGIKGLIKNIRPGPVVTLFEMEPAPGTKSSRVIGLSDDIARSMSAVSTRIAVIPGKNALGIELPNAKRETVYLRPLLEKKDYTQSTKSLPLVLGKDIGGDPVIEDLAKMPHLLVAGTTGSGKSVGINTMILSLLYKFSPQQCRFVMIDPKMLELSIYDGIPHLLAPVVTEPGKAVVALKWAVKEMENRYRLMSQLGVRNIAGYNQKIVEAAARGDQLRRTVQTGFDPETGKPITEEVPIPMEPLPFIVIIVDEMADLMLVAGKEIESSIQRLAQMARAAGLHLIMATQRPSVDVITGVIKANFPSRISFNVTSKIDSRTILGEQGAEQLLGQGDMLIMTSGSRITRVHGPFVSDEEVESVVSHLKLQGEPDYVEEVTLEDESEDPLSGLDTSDAEQDLYQKAVQVVVRDGKASTSYVQRRLKIGYNRAASLIERMEEEGVISGPNHTGKREVLQGI